ncbi:MAG: RluA family pseudouridine synthase [Myxococcales bacterium]|nr:RluA family pseudouridine synthase [Myxococcales bacterium]
MQDDQSNLARSFTVEARHAQQRLDKVLVELMPELSRARVKALLDEGQVRVDGRRFRKGDTLSEGAVITVSGALPPRDFSPEGADPAQAAALLCRYLDASLAVVEKPAAMPCHPLRPDEQGTLANLLVTRFPECRTVGFHQREPGLLHRLDTDTSGLVVVARTAAAFEALRAASTAGKVHKRYLALVEGRVSGEGSVDLPLVPHRKDPKRVEVVSEHVRLRAGTKTHPALTQYRVARALGDFTLLEVEVERAFRHQVRAHLAHIGHALVGDTLYRGPSLPAGLGVSLERHFLHASEVMLPHPETGVEVRVTSPLPDDLAAVVAALKK